VGLGNRALDEGPYPPNEGHVGDGTRLCIQSISTVYTVQNIWDFCVRTEGA